MAERRGNQKAGITDEAGKQSPRKKLSPVKIPGEGTKGRCDPKKIDMTEGQDTPAKYWGKQSSNDQRKTRFRCRKENRKGKKRKGTRKQVNFIEFKALLNDEIQEEQSLNVGQLKKNMTALGWGRNNPG